MRNEGEFSTRGKVELYIYTYGLLSSLVSELVLAGLEGIQNSEGKGIVVGGWGKCLGASGALNIRRKVLYYYRYQ
jgi:hypothetical protein